METMQAVGQFIRQRPRLAAAMAFGVSTALLIHFAWYPDARWNGKMSALSLAAGLAHALAGAIVGARLVDTRRTATASGAALLGAGISLLAMTFFAPAMTVYISAGDVLRSTVFGYAVMALYTGVFAYLAAGWAAMLLSMGVAWALYRMASTNKVAGPT